MHWNFQCKSVAPAVAAAPIAVPAAVKVANTLPSLSQLDLGTHGHAWMASSAFEGFSGWYFDSGVSHHMTAHSELFTARQDIHSEPISIANGKSCCDIALMRYWSSEYCNWRVALVTEVGEEDAAALTIFFAYFSAFHWL
jgi:hypothetical protein